MDANIRRTCQAPKRAPNGEVFVCGFLSFLNTDRCWSHSPISDDCPPQAAVATNEGEGAPMK